MGCGPKEYSLEGLAQKGPFQVGSQVIAQELDSRLDAEGVVYFTDTRDDFGAFSLAAKIKSPFVELRVSGYAYDELHFAHYYGSRGLVVTIPHWRPYIDGDGDGTVDHYEP